MRVAVESSCFSVAVRHPVAEDVPGGGCRWHHRERHRGLLVALVSPSRSRKIDGVVVIAGAARRGAPARHEIRWRGVTLRRSAAMTVTDDAMAGVDRFNGEFDDVLAAAQRGAPWAFERVWVALSPVVTGYLRTQGSQEPEDLTSEVFVAVLRNIGRFAGTEAGFRSWVFTIAHRRLLDERRTLGRRPVFADIAEAADLPSGDDVEAAAERLQRTAWVREVCERLSPDQRDVLLLRLLGRLTVEEVAAAVGKTPVAVKALQRRGFRAIGRTLAYEEVPL